MIKCARCKKDFIEEEYDSHECSPTLIGTKTIPIEFYVLTKEPKYGRETVLAMGMDGIMYTLIVQPTYNDQSDGSLQPDNNDKNRRRLDKADGRNNYILKCVVMHPCYLYSCISELWNLSISLKCL